MKKMSFALLSCLCLLVLSGCVTRENADKKMAKGCLAGAQSILPEGHTITTVKETTFLESPEGPDYRDVILKTVTMDGWLETEQHYLCVFEEEFGFLSSKHSALLYQLKTGDVVYGKIGDEIQGSTEDFVKLTEAVAKAMPQ